MAEAARLLAKSSLASNGSDQLGLSLNGGGNHALSAGYGILRGLFKKDDACSKLDMMLGVSGGMWTTAIYAFGYRDLSNAEALTKLLDPTRSCDPSLITLDLLNELDSGTLGYSAVRPFGCRALVLWPAYLAGGLVSQLTGLNTVNAHQLWIDSVHSTYLAPYGIKQGKFMAPNQETIDAFVKADPDVTAADFIAPRVGKDGPLPLPMGAFTMIGPSIPNQSNFLGPLKEMQKRSVEEGGTTEAVQKARKEFNGVCLVPWVATAATVYTKYQSEPDGPSEMAFDHWQFRGGCSKPPPLRFNDTEALDIPSYKFAQPSREWCTPGGNVTTDRFTLDTLVGFSSDVLEAELNLVRCCNPLLGTLSGRLNIQTAPNDSALKEGVLNQASCNFGDGAIIDNTGIASLVAQGVRSIVAMVSASKSFYPPPPPALAAAGKAMEVGRAARLQARGRSLASVAAAELAVVQQIQEHLGSYLEGLYHPQGKAPLDSSLVSLFGLMHVPDDQQNQAGAWVLAMNHVLQAEKLYGIVRDFTELYHKGAPLVATLEDCEVQSNPFHGTTRNDDKGQQRLCTLTVVYFTKPGETGSYKESADKLPKWEPSDLYVPGSWAACVGSAGGENEAIWSRRDMRDFPYLAPIAQNLFACPPRLAAYTKAQVNLMAYLGDFIIEYHWEKLLAPVFARGSNTAVAAPACGSPAWSRPACGGGGGAEGARRPGGNS